MFSRWFHSWPFYPRSLEVTFTTFEGVTFSPSQKGHQQNCQAIVFQDAKSWISSPNVRNKKTKNTQKNINLLGQWLNFKLFGLTYLVGKIKFKLFFFRVHWLSEYYVFFSFWIKLPTSNQQKKQLDASVMCRKLVPCWGGYTMDEIVGRNCRFLVDPVFWPHQILMDLFNRNDTFLQWWYHWWWHTKIYRYFFGILKFYYSIFVFYTVHL